MSQITRVSRFGFVNAYLVAEDDGLTLIDTMIPRSSNVIIGAAKRLGAPIARIVLTRAWGPHRLARRAQGHASRCRGADLRTRRAPAR